MTELNLLKEFKNKRAQLEKDFDQMKEAAEQAQQAHAEKIKRMEVLLYGMLSIGCPHRFPGASGTVLGGEGAVAERG